MSWTGQLTRPSERLGDAKTATDLARQEIRNLCVPRNGLDRTGRGVQPEGVSAALAFEHTSVTA